MSIHTRKLPGDGNVRPGTVFFSNPPIVLPSGPQPAPESHEPEATAAPPEAPRARRAEVPMASIEPAAEQPWYRKERWLVVQLAALIPILGAMLVPVAYRVPLCILGGVLVAIGTVMMLRHDPTDAGSGRGVEAGSS
jgi:hypothetical protein